jgi:hypothetical protein
MPSYALGGGEDALNSRKTRAPLQEADVELLLPPVRAPTASMSAEAKQSEPLTANATKPTVCRKAGRARQGRQTWDLC